MTVNKKLFRICFAKQFFFYFVKVLTSFKSSNTTGIEKGINTADAMPLAQSVSIEKSPETAVSDKIATMITQTAHMIIRNRLWKIRL